MASILASGLSCPGFDSQCAQKISEENINNIAEVNKWPWLEERVQWLENVDQTHLELTSGKLQASTTKIKIIVTLLSNGTYIFCPTGVGYIP